MSSSADDIEPTPPWLASIPLTPGHEARALVIVHPGRAVAPAEGLSEVLRFHPAAGGNGWISAARAADGRWGYIDGEGRWRVAPTLQEARSFSEDGLARFCDGGRWGFVDLTGTVVLPPTFINAQPFRNGLCAVQVGEGAWRIIDRTGRPTCGEVFHALGPFGANGLARATLWRNGATGQHTHGFVDRSGRWVVGPRFRSAGHFGTASVVAASLDGGLHGLINAQGHWVLQPRYPHIGDFNEEGLAYFDEPNAWDQGHGYLDEQGRVAVRGGRHLSRHMACGVAANSYDGTSYLTASGGPLPTPALSYGADFSDETGYAIVRTAAVRHGSAPAPAPAHWGLLHADGRFVPTPEHLLEPLTNREGWLVGYPPDTPLTPFLTRDGQLAFIDAEGAVVWRAHYDGQQVALLGSDNAPLWCSGVRTQGDCWPPRPFFNAPLTDHLENLESLDGIVPLALDLLADAEARLHRLAAGDAVAADDAPADGEIDRRGGEDGTSSVSGLHRDALQADRTVVMRRVARASLSPSHHGPYEFLCSDLHRTVDEARLGMAQRLAARFGTADPNPEHAAPAWHRRGDCMQAWPVPLARPLPGDGTALPEAREQWLSLYKRSEAGNGGTRWELWLMVAPSIDALQLAQRAAGPQGAVAEEAGGPVGRDTTARKMQGPSPSEDAELIARLRSQPGSLAEVPRERITHAMVDAALAADEGAVRFVPKRLMTPARYAAALRQGVKDFDQIPADMLGEEACIAHVQQGGWRLEQVPPAQRSVAVCTQAVLDSSSALAHVPEALREQVREAVAHSASRQDAARASAAPARAGGVAQWLARRLADSAPKGHHQATRRLQHGDLAAFPAQAAALPARADRGPPQVQGLARWFKHYPRWALAAHLLLGVAALAGHAAVSVAAWQAEGAWIGLATLVLMGFSELYWGGHFLWADPASPALACAAAAVVAYVFGWRRLARRFGSTARH